ncbi:sulfate transport system ATP-binding protein [Lachnotalea glycerini]|uniref:ABC-type quaternary amine transporter n=1 Tax=Lachnotalea glycerini TaxID=1763509 RepID=A0A255IP73_9FIRM|nr:sulfate ABC transporter ATP-binding protein [Lachnotalea glycerini]PXV96055.1 sulfate transport system ATP-binding protein [Lachnotalea glycerini]RDY30588.1 sulfate ABC transporter ATP-binding protein [Lachnotalea glycerini]
MYVELKNIEKSYGNYKASDHINIGIGKGKLVALLGPSGSGKTTILRMIAGLETPNAGDIIIDGKRVNDIAPAERGIGFVFQNYALFRYMTVYENLAFGLKIKKLPKKQIKERVIELIELTGLKGLEKRYPNQLSGGQRQRVAFARALAPNPSLLLLDEPFAAIDAKVRAELRSWLREMIHKVGITSIFVTHDQDEAVEVADEIIITNKGQIEQIAAPIEIYKNPKTPFVAEFIGQSSKIDDYHKLRGFEKGDYKGAIIRPEFVESFKSDNVKFKDVINYSEDGVIEDIYFRGNCLEVKLNVGGIILTTKRSLERRPIQIGERMHVIVYRLYAYDNERAYLLENKDLKGKELVTF